VESEKVIATTSFLMVDIQQMRDTMVREDLTNYHEKRYQEIEERISGQTYDL
jgi:hypothetical protein